MSIVGILIFAGLGALVFWLAIRADLRDQGKKRGDFKAFFKELEDRENERRRDE